MKVAFIATLLSLLFAFVAALPNAGVNADRLARGLSPLPPVRRHATPPGPPKPHPSHVSQCNGGSVKCCNSVAGSNDPIPKFIAGLLNIALPLNSIVGVKCTDLNIGGIGGNSCSGQTVCCNGNNFSGLITLGCTPISIGL